VTVVQRLGDFERTGAIVAEGAGQAALIELMHAMRQDVTNSATLLKQEDLMHILFSHGTTNRSAHLHQA
jgi:hypothetical protein